MAEVLMQEGGVYPVKLVRSGGSLYVCVDKNMQLYLGIEDNPEGHEYVLKAESSKKWGRYFGFGVKKA